MNDPEAILAEYFGYSQFRPNQLEIINSLLAGKDTFGLLPTGGGKSACYQIPALILDGLTLIITPLVSLMIDQEESLKARGINAVAVHSGLSFRQVEIALDNCAFGNTKIMFCAPERLQSPLFRARIEQFNINLIAVDEAHCVSEWGHDFRPSYLRINEIRDIFPEVPMLALTATATKKVEGEVIELLGLKTPAIYKSSFRRENISFSIRRVEDKDAKLIEILEHVQGSSIIYVRSRKKARELSQWLVLKKGISSTYYHAGLNPTSRMERQKMWKNNRHRVMVATNAFGMGIDKPDVRLVIHYEAPPSLESYYQEAGRAGRDGKLAYAVILYHQLDKKLLKDRFEIAHPKIKYLKQIYQSLANYYQLASGSGKDQKFDFDLADFSQRYNLKTLNVYQALKRLEEEGLILLSESIKIPSTLKLQLAHDELYEFQVANGAYDLLLKGVLRLYGGQIFSDFIKVEEAKISQFLNQPVEEINESLLRLDKMDVLSYNPQSDKPQLTFITERKPADDLFVSSKRLSALKKSDLERMNAVVEYLDNTDQCRMKQILSYFGEKGKECGKCDHCLQKNKSDSVSIEKITRLLNQDPLEIKAVLARFSMVDEEDVKMVIKRMLDSGLVVIDNGVLSLKN